MSLNPTSLYRAIGSFLKDPAIQGGLVSSSLGGLIGLKQGASTFSNPNDSSEASRPNPSSATLGIGAVTTAGVLASMHAKIGPGKYPALGLALAAGAAYATGRIYGSIERQKQEATNSSEPSLSSKLLEGTLGLGALYFGGKAIVPYVARSVYRMDQQFRPWFSALGETVNQAQLGKWASSTAPGIGGAFPTFANIFDEKLAAARATYANASHRFPLNKYLHQIAQVDYNLADDSLRGSALNHIVDNLLKEHGVRGPSSTVNGLRQATLQDILRHPQYATKPGMRSLVSSLARKGVDYNSISLGKGVLFDTTNKANPLLNMSKLTPGSIGWDALRFLQRNFKVPFLGNPFGFLRLNEINQAFESKYKFHIFTPGAPLGANLNAGEKGTAFVGGKLFDIASGKEVTAGGILVKAGQWRNWTESTPRHFEETTFGAILRARQGAGLHLKAPAGKINIGNSFVKEPKSWFEKILYNLELDPNFSQHPSLWSKIFGPIKRANKANKGVLESIKSSWAVFRNQDLHQIAAEEIGSAKSKTFSAFPVTFHKNLEGKTVGESFAFLPYSDLPGTAAHFLYERPVRLMEEMGLGGFDPRTTRSATDVISKLLLKRILPIYGAYKAAQLINDLTGGAITGTFADIAAGITTSTSYIRQSLGITRAANYLNQLMPGSINSPLATGIRAFGIPLFAGMKWGPAGLMAGEAASLFLGGTGDITQSAQDLREQYFGNKDVAVRAHAHWAMSSGPFAGGKIQAFVPNWYRRMKSRYWYTETMYGSSFEYWSNYFNRYHYAIKHYYDRPYPVATSGLEEIPFVGPFAANIIAPPMYMHTPGAGLEGQNSGINIEGNQQGLGFGQANGITMGTPGHGASYGYGNSIIAGSPLENIVSGAPVVGFDPNSPHGMMSMKTGQAAINPIGTQGIAANVWNAQTEYLGMYGFAAKVVKEKLTGSQNVNDQYSMLASTTQMNGLERQYWQMNLGDPGSIASTELLRRFIPKASWQQQKINPIINTQPGFMPGDETIPAFNYRRGDPYSKAPGGYGETRLPGEAYWKFHTPGYGISTAAQSLGTYNLGLSQNAQSKPYSMLDIYRILGDVAPYSPQFKYASQYIMAMSKAGMLTPEGEIERKNLKKEFAAKKKTYEFTTRQFTEGDLQNINIKVGQYLGAGRFTAQGIHNKIYQLSSLKGITPEGEAKIQEIIKPGTSLTVQALNDERYQTKTSTVNPTVPVLINNLNRQLVTSGQAQYDKEGPADIYAPLNTRVQYNLTERIVGKAYENIAHMDIPILSKYLNVKTPLEQYEKNYLYAPPGTSWYHPVQSYLMPGIRRMTSEGPIHGAVLGAIFGKLLTKGPIGKIGPIIGAAVGAGLSSLHPHGYVPSHRQKEWEVEQYYDILKYLKYNRLYEYTRQLAIEKEGIDPGKLIQKIEASKNARQSVQKAVEQQQADLRLKALETTGNLHSRLLAKRKQIAADTQFLHYQKYLEDQAASSVAGSYAGSALKYHELIGSTMYGANVRGDFASLLRALPKQQRDFFTPFLTAPKEKRDRILRETPIGMRRMLEAKWGMKVEKLPNLENYFQTHYLPNADSAAWHPAVDLNDVKLKTVQQEGFNLHDFGLWETQLRDLNSKPYVPLINPFDTKHQPHIIKQELKDIIRGAGYNNYDLEVTNQLGPGNMNINMDIQYNNQPEAINYIHKNLPKLTNGVMS